MQKALAPSFSDVLLSPVAMDTPACGETDVLTRAREGDPEAFVFLFEQHKQSVYWYVFQMMRNEEEARDVFQDVFLRAWRGIRAFRGEASFKTWVFRIATHVCLRMLEKAKKTKLLWEVSPPEPSSGSLSVTVRQALLELLPSHRAALSLHYLQGYSVEEVSSMLRVSVGTVKSRLFHARLELKEKLKGWV